MKNYGLTSVATLLDDNIVYRNMAPLDQRLPTFVELASRLKLRSRSIPRKSESDYARVMATLLRHARALDGSVATIERLIYVGDTRLNDGTAFSNLCEAGAWPGLAFICAESAQPPAVQIGAATNDTAQTAALYLANRWAMLADFNQYCQKRGLPIDESTAVVLDLDKTTLGARGRNDHLINAARLEAVRQTVQTLLEDAFDPEGFKRTYDLFNDTAFHPFTTDNQDYLAYLCLILGSKIFAEDRLIADIRTGRFQSFVEWMEEVEVRAHDLPESLHTLHADIYARVQAGDPTPFKAFRYNEYRTTVSRMGQLAPDADPATLLDQEIVLTQEVREIALNWRAQGALLFGLSDKPDEASIPTPRLAAEGYRSIHRTPTHAVGDDTWSAPSTRAHDGAKTARGMA